MSHKTGLVKVYENTVHLSHKNKRKYPKPRTITYTGLLKDYAHPRPFGDVPAEVSVVEEDTIVAGLKLVDEKLNPVLLNMASDRKPGGGVEKGCRAQEEEMFRRTNYCMHLNRKNVKYPLDPLSVVYTPDVTVLKDEKYNVVETRPISFIACAGVRDPYLKDDGRMRSQDRQLLKAKIRMIFQTAVYHGHDSLVLGALGCGAFYNPPEDVAATFKLVISEYQPGVFKKIVFAVKSCGRDRNFAIFHEQLSSQ